LHPWLPPSLPPSLPHESLHVCVYARARAQMSENMSAEDVLKVLNRELARVSQKVGRGAASGGLWFGAARPTACRQHGNSWWHCHPDAQRRAGAG